MYHVVRTTTEKLEQTINDSVSNPDVSLHTLQWLGGRDWVLVLDVALGWVADQDTRYAEYDRAVADGAEFALTPPDGLTLVAPEVVHGDVRYGRYDTHRTGPDFTAFVEDAARSWIIFFGPHGSPALYWPRRDAHGGVIGAPIDLTHDPAALAALLKSCMYQLLADLDNETVSAAEVKRRVISRLEPLTTVLSVDTTPTTG